MEKTNMVTQVANSSTGGYWFMKPILAASATVIAAVSLVGCSHGNAAPIAAGSNNNAAAGGDNSDANSGSHAAQTGGENLKKTCTAVVGTISGEQQREDDPDPIQHSTREQYTVPLQPGGSRYGTFQGSREGLKIAVDAYGNTHSKELHRRVKDFCGPYFDPVVKQITDEFQHASDDPFTPDWSL